MSQAAQKNESPETQGRTEAIVRHVAVSKPKAEPEMAINYKVRDKLAYAGVPRIHELYDSRGIPHKFTFPNDTAFVDMPMPLAAKLIANEGFEVINERGYPMRAETFQNDSGGQGVILAFDEVVAKYDELTHEGLLTRAVKLNPSLNKNTKKDELISFLIEASLVGSKSAVSTGEEEELDIEEESEFA